MKMTEKEFRKLFDRACSANVGMGGSTYLPGVADDLVRGLLRLKVIVREPAKSGRRAKAI